MLFQQEDKQDTLKMEEGTGRFKEEIHDINEVQVNKDLYESKGKDKLNMQQINVYNLDKDDKN